MRVVIILVSIALVTGMMYVLYENRLDIRNVETEYVMDTNALLKDFNSNNQKSLKKYIEKAIEVQGVLHKTTKRNGTYTLMLQGSDMDIYVLCEMEKDQNNILKNLQEGDEVKVKGILKGFLKDAIMLNCIIMEEMDE